MPVLQDGGMTHGQGPWHELQALRERIRELEVEVGLMGVEDPAPRCVHRCSPATAWAYSMLAELGSDLMSIQTPAGEYRFASPNVTQLFGWAPEELVGRSVYDLCHPEDVADLAAARWATGAEEVQIVRYRLRCGDGSYRWVETRGRGRRGPDGRGYVVCLSRDIEDEVRAQDATLAARAAHEADLRRLALEDGLTGLPNRRAADQELFRAWARAEREGQELCVAMLDVDHFKQINDSLGHAAGDAVLERLGRLLQDNLRQGDFVARWGGEEFLLVLHADSDPASVAERIRETVRRSVFPHGVRLTVSMGIAWREVASDPDRLVEAADRALYEAKTSGRDRVRVAPPLAA
jgi:diguanylate cyclase (GGDEF)-like protein/PAS domain S-box-containing protein